MLTEILQPSPLLKSVVKYYKYIPENINGRFKAIPSNEIELYFNYNPIHVFVKGKYDLVNPKVCVTGLHDLDQEIYSEMSDTGRLAAFVIVFQPTGIYNLFRIKPSDFMNYILLPEFRIRRQIQDLWGSMELLESAYQMREAVEEFLFGIIKKTVVKNQIINSIFAFAHKNGGMLVVKDLCETFNLAMRKLQRMLKDETGLSPKELLNIYRINHALDLLSSKNNSNLAAVGQMCGFYDQAHFIREIKSRIGFTPGKLAAHQEKTSKKVDSRHFIRA
jgi:AraC-like DNA-binding protein